MEDGYSKVEAYTEATLERARGIRAELSGVYDYDNKTMNASDGDLKATLTFIDEDTVRVKVNSPFRRAFSVDAEGTYERHYGK